MSDFRKVCVIDPAGTSKTQNDFTAAVVLGVRSSRLGSTPPAETAGGNAAAATPARGGVIYCLHAWIRHATPLETARAAKRIHDQFGPLPIWCEANVFNEWGKAAFEQVESAPPIRTYRQTGNKDDRIIGLQADFESGRFYFDPTDSDQHILIDQFLDYGKAAVHDDGPDAFEEAVRRLERRTRAGGRCRREPGERAFELEPVRW